MPKILSLSNCILDTNFETSRELYKGKVRDCYIGNEDRIIIASDRISAFDHVFDEAIPLKGQVLNQVAVWALRKTEDIIENHILEVPDPNVVIAKECDPIKLEIVVRGYLTGHAWRTYKSGKRILCGINLPEGLIEHSKFDSPIITPSTKADIGHDEDISKEEAIAEGLISKELFEEVAVIAQKLFARGTELAKERNLILVDTKYEFGIYKGKLMLMDEIHTPDSSRYFYADSYENYIKTGEKPEQLSKEFLREWLMANNFQGKEGQIKPKLTDDIRIKVSEKYIELFETLTGNKFEISEDENIIKRIQNNIIKWL